MFNNWLTLRQAEEALNGGRLDEALRLVRLPEIEGHKRAGELKTRIAKALLDRAGQHLHHANGRAAWHDLEKAESVGIKSSELMGFRQTLIERNLRDANEALDRGEPANAESILDELAKQAPNLSEANALLEVSRSWKLAQELAARGEMGQAYAAVDRVIRLGARRWQRLDEFKRELARRRSEMDDLLARLHESLEQERHREVIGLADQILAIAPQHGVARKARERAWHAVQPPTIIAPPNPASTSPKLDAQWPRRFLVWIDGVGGYLVCLSSRVSFGQATPDAIVDVPLFADISRLHGYLTRDAEGYLLEAVRSVAVNDRPADRRLLSDGDRLTLGASCKLRFRKPVALSATAILEITSGHRLPVAVNGIVMMAETLVFGAAADSHVAIPELRRSIVLHRQGEGIRVKASGSFTVNKEMVRERGLLTPDSTVVADDFRMTLEPVEAGMGKIG